MILKHAIKYVLKLMISCLLIGYAEHSVACRFLVLKNDVLDYNTSVETKNAKFFEHIFHFVIISHALVEKIIMRILRNCGGVKGQEKSSLMKIIFKLFLLTVNH